MTNLKKEDLQYIHDTIIGWIKTADSKARTLLVLNVGSLFLYQLDRWQINGNGHWWALAFWLFAILTFIFLIISIIWPRVKNKVKGSKIFFGSIANKHKLKKMNANETVKVIENFTKYKEKEFKEDLSAQILINANIANLKYSLLKIATIFLVISYLVGATSISFANFYTPDTSVSIEKQNILKDIKSDAERIIPSS